jgi:hypothetical protein
LFSASRTYITLTLPTAKDGIFASPRPPLLSPALFIGIHPCRKATVEYEAATTRKTGKALPLAGIRFKAVAKSLLNDHRDSLRLWLSMYCLTIAGGASPTVLTK